jgi:flagella basal body P-ring formation protein FlgA
MRLLLLSLLMTQTPREPAKEAAPIQVSVRAVSEVSGRTFTLGEVADITGDDKTLSAQIAAVELGTSPLVGLARGLTLGDIVVRLRMHRVDMKRVKVECPPGVKVQRGGQEVPVSEITAAAKAVLETTPGAAVPGVEMEPLPLSTRVMCTSGKREIKAGAPRGSLGSGVMTVPVTVYVDGAPARTIEVGFRVKRSIEMLVAARPIEAKQIITAEDVTLTRMEPVGSIQPLSDAALAIGKRATRRHLQGQPLTASSVEVPPAVLMGSRVQVLSGTGGITVTAEGIAKSAGAPGDVVTVTLLATRRDMKAVVVDAKTVKVEGN